METVQTETQGRDMVSLAHPTTTREYEVYGVSGQRLGRVTEVEGPPVLGVGAATVLLQRSGEGLPPRG